MLILPIRTETVARCPPHANYVLLGTNVAVFLLFRIPIFAEMLAGLRDKVLAFEAAAPRLHQFFTYQFLHADVGHLAGNMVFLWVFGNAVNGKIGHLPYVLFYLAGGVFAAWGHAMAVPQPFQLVGASGAIAAVTTAYLALFPRSRVMVLIWFFFFIHFLEVPAMILIGVKIIVWDNILAPGFGGPSNVAYGAHLSGYAFGFAGALFMLATRAIARDQFDILAVWKRWNQRREFAAIMGKPGAAARGRYGSIARMEEPTGRDWEAEAAFLDQVAALRSRISDALLAGDASSAADDYARLLELDPRQVLAPRQQLLLGRETYATRRFPQAARIFERFVEAYPAAEETPEVRLLLGILYAKELNRLEPAQKHLRQALDTLKDPARRDQCESWLREVRAAGADPGFAK